LLERIGLFTGPVAKMTACMGYGKLEFLQTHELQKFPILQLKLNTRTPAIQARLISIAPGYGAGVITCSYCLNNTSDILIGIILNH
jgi:hypothetical protein